MNVIVVTTGGGFDYDTEIDQHLVGAVVDLETPLPANPEGVAKLAAAVDELAQPDVPQPVIALPDAAKAISGKTYVFEPNAANLESMSLELNDSSEAVIHLKYFGSDQVLTSLVGLDGIFRPAAQGELYRGHWADAQTFILEIYDVGTQTIQLHFEDDKVTIQLPVMGVSFEGKIQSP